MMTDWYQKSIDSLALSGKADRTQEAYSRAQRMLCDFYDKTPDEIDEAEFEACFLHRATATSITEQTGSITKTQSSAICPSVREKLKAPTATSSSSA